MLEVESLSAVEKRVSLRVGDSWCRSNDLELRAGVRLGVTACQFEPSFSFAAMQPPAEIELVVAKGDSFRAYTPYGHELPRGGATLQLGRTRFALPLDVRVADGVQMECVSLSMSEARLRELLGVAELPEVYRDVTDSEDPCALVSHAATPKLLRLLDEIVNADARGKSRMLWHEAKCLELIALVTDELAATEQHEPSLSASEVARLERVRRRLVERLDAPPTLSELARGVGLNETRLKRGFRFLFGTSVFAYLRQVRMEEARRLLRERDLNVTEVALRVGYANPSKFAAAFRRQFGTSPSAV